MFIRSILSATSCTIIAVITSSFAQLAHADITKCRELDGSIIYSNTSCGSAIVLRVIAEDTGHPSIPSAPVVRSVHISTNSAPATARNQVHESIWAHRDIAVAKKSVDTFTIKSAREALAFGDRAIASLHQQTVALNR